MSENNGFMKALKCRECGREYPLEATHVCEFDFGPLEVVYDYDRIKKSMTRTPMSAMPWPMPLPAATLRRRSDFSAAVPDVLMSAGPTEVPLR